MYHYELTERGKIVIAIVLVILLLLVPSVILFFRTIASQPSEQQNPGASENPIPTHAVTPLPEITNTPPPNGGGINTPDTTPSGNVSVPSDVTPTPPEGVSGPSDVTPTPPEGASGPSDVTPPVDVDKPGETEPGSGQEPSEPPISGPTGGNPSRGTLSFLFSPKLQNELDVSTLAKLDEFIGSPKNTKESLISIELPELSGADAEKIISVVSNAFTARDVSRHRLEFITKPTAVMNGAYEIHLSFIQLNIK
jgi:hypothetical protein